MWDDWDLGSADTIKHGIVIQPPNVASIMEARVANSRARVLPQGPFLTWL